MILRRSIQRIHSVAHQQCRFLSTQTSAPLHLPKSPFAPRHFLSTADLTPSELTTLILEASKHKSAIKSSPIAESDIANFPSKTTLLGQTIALIFNKRSTRTRISTEAAISRLGGHTMFLSPNDIQLGVNESLYDTSVVVSSMVSAIVARVHGHEDVEGLAKYSSVPVINALSDQGHPLQCLADYLTMFEMFGTKSNDSRNGGLGLQGLKVAWVGDANNVLYDLAIGAMKLGVDLAVASPKGYGLTEDARKVILGAREGVKNAGSLTETEVPSEAIKNANVVATDTWISMGQEKDTAIRMKDFEGFQITKELIDKSGANDDWRFMHCLPRHAEEVVDEIFYSPKSVVFQEAENRLYSAISAIEAFVVNKGRIIQSERE